MNKVFTLLSVALTSLSAIANPIDFGEIRHWTGNGSNRAALAIRFEDEGTTFVWGYRWSEDETPTGEDMLRAVCGNSDRLVMLTQFTGQYGSTLCGMGYGDAEIILDNISFDFAKAKDSEWINFNYYSVNPFFGQQEAPGDNTPKLCQEAIDAARSTHVIQHPIDYYAYGYPAYDYDCWLLRDKGTDGQLWRSGWYEGYWSYWLGNDASADWQYSGSGFSGRRLSDGAVDAWTFSVFATPGIGGIGEGTPPVDNPSRIEYIPAPIISEVAEGILGEATEAEYYTLSGILVDTSSLTPGIYIMRKGSDVRKILVR